MASLGLRADPTHDGLEAERAAVDARFEVRRGDCVRRFMAASCLDAARIEHRDALARVRAQELELQDAARHRAAAAKRAALAAKSAAGDVSDRPVSAPPAAPRNEPSPPERLFPRPSALPHARGPTGAARIEQERANTARFEARTREAEAHRAQVLQRNAERAAAGRQAAPLPTPALAPDLATPGR